MSVILQPQVPFPLVRQIANHTDGTVYYVRAVIRNAAGDIIDAVNLASQGGQRYQASWRVPADTSGQGAYISVVTSVYVDSGYTSKSENYGDEETTYLIFDRVMPAMRGGGGGLARRDVRDVIREELAKLPQPEKIEIIPDFPEMKWGDVLSNIAYLADAVEKLPKEQTSLEPLKAPLEAIKRAIEEKPVTKAADLSSVVSAITELKAQVVELGKEQNLSADELRNYMEGMEQTLSEKIATSVTEAVEQTEFVTTQTVTPARKPRQEETFDANQFAK